MSSILTPRKEAAPLRYFVHHSRVAAVALAFNLSCSLSIRLPNAGAEGSRRFMDRSPQLVGAGPTGCHPRSCGGRERGSRAGAPVNRTQASALPLLVVQLSSVHPSRLPASQTRPRMRSLPPQQQVFFVCASTASCACFGLLSQASCCYAIGHTVVTPLRSSCTRVPLRSGPLDDISSRSNLVS